MLVYYTFSSQLATSLIAYKTQKKRSIISYQKETDCEEGNKTGEGNHQEEQGGSQVRRSLDVIVEIKEGGSANGGNSQPGPSKVHSVKNFNGGDGKSPNSKKVNSKEGGMGDGACKKEVGNKRVQTKGVQTSVTESNPQRTLLRYVLQKMLGEV